MEKRRTNGGRRWEETKKRKIGDKIIGESKPEKTEIKCCTATWVGVEGSE